MTDDSGERTHEHVTDELESDVATDEEGDVEERPQRSDEALAIYEYGGGVAAGLGFFLTPVVAGPPACYCAMRLRHEKPVSAMLILATVASTVLFWWLVVWFVLG